MRNKNFDPRRLARYIGVALSTIAVLYSFMGLAFLVMAPEFLFFEGGAGIRRFGFVWIITIGLLWWTHRLGTSSNTAKLKAGEIQQSNPPHG